MLILGHGLIARSLTPYRHLHPDTIAFARGVAASSATDEMAFVRESTWLEEALSRARSSGQRLVYFSGGGAVYGRVRRPASEVDECQPQSAYGRHQLRCERMVAEAGIVFVILRLTNIVGPTSNRNQLVPALVEQILLQHTVEVHRNALRDLVDGEDLGRIVSELLARITDSAIVNVASGHLVSAESLVEDISEILHLQPTKVLVDRGENQSVSNERMKGILGYDPFPDPGRYRVALRRYVPTLAEEILRGVGEPPNQTGFEIDR